MEVLHNSAHHCKLAWAPMRENVGLQTFQLLSFHSDWNYVILCLVSSQASPVEGQTCTLKLWTNLKNDWDMRSRFIFYFHQNIFLKIKLPAETELFKYILVRCDLIHQSSITYFPSYMPLHLWRYVRLLYAQNQAKTFLCKWVERQDRWALNKYAYIYILPIVSHFYFYLIPYTGLWKWPALEMWQTCSVLVHIHKQKPLFGQGVPEAMGCHTQI